VIKLSTGRKIYRTKIENSFFYDENIDHFLVFGNEKPYLVGLVTVRPGFHPTTEWKAGLEKTLRDLNGKLNSYEQVHEFILADRPLLMELEELTPNLKVRYEVVENNFRKHLEQVWKKKVS
jgi:long-subunit acyl-CoA synthetase (AMP-forming)